MQIWKMHQNELIECLYDAYWQMMKTGKMQKREQSQQIQEVRKTQE